MAALCEMQRQAMKDDVGRSQELSGSVHICGLENVNTRLSKCGRELSKNKTPCSVGESQEDRRPEVDSPGGTLDQVSSSDHLTWWEGQQESEVMGRVYYLCKHTASSTGI